MNSRSTVPLRTGRDMPVLGFGTWELTVDTASAVENALELGYRMIDTSGDYGTQPGVGEGFRRSGLERDEVYVVTKVEEDEDPLESTRRNLGELGMDRADLVLLHRPPPGGTGRGLWEELLEVREEGLARDVGVSNYSIPQVEEITRASGEAPVVNQIEWSPFGWSPDMLAFGREREIVIQAYSPLTRAERLDDPRLGRLADVYGKTPAQAMLRWDLQLGTVPIPKAADGAHRMENLAIFDFDIRDKHMRELSELNEQYSSLGASPQYVRAGP